jgi:hypothetical protein
MFHSYSFVIICLWPWACATRDTVAWIQLIAELVADDNDVQKSSAISIKNLNKIMDDVKSATSPSINDEEVTVSSISIISTLSIILQHIISFVHEPYYFLLFLGRTGGGGV